MDQSEIAKAIINDVIASQDRPFEVDPHSPLPPMLWVGDGRSIKASNNVFRLIHQLAERFISEDVVSTDHLLYTEIADTIGTVIANTLVDKTSQEIDIIDEIDVIALIKDEFDRKVNTGFIVSSYHFGCSLVHGVEIQPFSVGPVTFSAKVDWLATLEQNGQASKITSRRLKNAWSGKKISARKASGDQWNEHGLLEAVGAAPMVCSISMGKQSGKAARPKAELAGRLAMAAVTLMWSKPSSALARMSFNLDGPVRLEKYAVSSASKNIGYGSTVYGAHGGQHVSQDWLDSWLNFAPELAPIGRALELYVDPSLQTQKSNLMSSVFMSLWWFYEGCRARSDLIATTYFAASMDSISGGQRAKGIKAFFYKHVISKADAPFFTDGRKIEELVNSIYELTRNQVFHGSFNDHGKDWSRQRSEAEFLARTCILYALDWINNNPNKTKMKEILI